MRIEERAAVNTLVGPSQIEGQQLSNPVLTPELTMYQNSIA
jgi:hypothetical protein